MAGARPRLAFIHIPKTAGTSVATALMRHYDRLTCPAMTTLDYPRFTTAALANFRFFKGHAYRRDYERLPNDTKRFTVLRDPVSRSLSYYRYCRALDETKLNDPFVREASRLAKTVSPIEFVYSDSPFLIEHLRLGQLRQFLPESTLAAVGHRQFLSRELRRRAVDDFKAAIEGFDYVLTVECLNLSFALMAHEVGLPGIVSALGRENVSTPCEEVDTADLRRALVDVNAAEFECYAAVQHREQSWLTANLVPLLSQAS